MVSKINLWLQNTLCKTSAIGFSLVIAAGGVTSVWAQKSPSNSASVRQLDAPLGDVQQTAGGLLGLKCAMMAFAQSSSTRDAEQSAKAQAKFRKWQQFAIAQQPDSPSLAPTMNLAVNWARTLANQPAQRDRFALTASYLQVCDTLRSQRFPIDTKLTPRLFSPTDTIETLEQSISRTETGLEGLPHNTIGFKCFAMALEIKRAQRATTVEQAFAHLQATSWVFYGEVPPATAQLLATTTDNPATRWANRMLQRFSETDRVAAAQTYLKACDLIASR